MFKKIALSTLLPVIAIVFMFGYPKPAFAIDVYFPHPLIPYPPIPDSSVASEWASAHITRAHSLGLIPHSLFADSPTFTNYTIPATREEFAALAVALYDTIVFGGPTVRLEIEGVGIPGAMEFNDTDDINVRVMGYLGVVSGVGDGYFNPYGEITREQAAVMLVRLFNVIHTHVGTDWPVMLDLPHLPSVFTDYEQISPWAFNGVASAFGLKLMSGVGDRQFAPQSTFTREQSIVAVLQLFDMVQT